MNPPDVPVEALIDRYCEAWSLPDAEARAQALAEVWAEGARYSDPSVDVAGAADLLAHIERVRAQLPGMAVRRCSCVDLHRGVARFAWQAVREDGSTLPEGLDIAFLAADARHIARIIGFFGPLRKRPTDG